MGGQLVALTQDDFSHGENPVTSPYKLRPEQVQQSINQILDEQGALRTRDGTLKQGVSAPRPDRPIVKLYDFVNVGLTIRRLAIQLGTFANNSLFLRDTSPWSPIGDFGSIYATPDVLTFTNLAILAGGQTEVLRSYDGTTFAALAGAPNACHVANHLSFLWAWNTSPITNVAAHLSPSSLQMSDLNNAASWAPSNQTFIALDDGTQGQGLALYTIAETGISPTATIIAFKDFSGYECSGVLGAVGFAVQKIKSDMGCVAPRSIQFVSGFGVIRMTHRGFALYDGVNDTIISEEERPRIFGRDSFTGLDWGNITKSMAWQVANPPIYCCACPISGGNGSLQRVFFFDLVRRAWTVGQYGNDISTGQLMLDQGQLPTVMLGDFSKGFVRRTFAGDANDDGTAIPWNMVTGQKFLKSPLTRSYWLGMQLSTFGMTPNATINATFFYSPTTPRLQDTVTKTLPTVTALVGFAGWGADPWSNTAWGSQNATTVTDLDTFFFVPGGVKCNSVAVSLSGSGPGKIRALEFRARELPLTKSTVVNA